MLIYIIIISKTTSWPEIGMLPDPSYTKRFLATVIGIGLSASIATSHEETVYRLFI